MASFSRINQRQQSKALIFSISMIFGAIAVITLFFTVLLPFFLNRMGQSAKPTQVDSDILPPSAPMLDSAFEATNSAQVILTGFAEPDTVVAVRKNGILLQEITSGQDGKFLFPDVLLSQGMNKLEFTARDPAGNESSVSFLNISYSTEGPELSITSPQNNSTVTKRRDQVITIQGTTTSSSRVLVNDKVAIVGSDGSFSASFQLQEGANTIQVRAISPAGTETVQELLITFQP